MQFTCTDCGKTYEDIPSFGADRPAQYWDVPEDKRDEDVFLTTDSCVIADRFFFIRGCIDIPIIGTEESFTWGVWVSLKDENFFLWQDYYNTQKRSHVGPFFGWLSTSISVYPDTVNLKTMVYLRDEFIRPYIELEQTNHPLALDQQNGITVDRVAEIVHELEREQSLK